MIRGELIIRAIDDEYINISHLYFTARRTCRSRDWLIIVDLRDLHSRFRSAFKFSSPPAIPMWKTNNSSPFADRSRLKARLKCHPYRPISKTLLTFFPRDALIADGPLIHYASRTLSLFLLRQVSHFPPPSPFIVNFILRMQSRALCSVARTLH